MKTTMAARAAAVLTSASLITYIAGSSTSAHAALNGMGGGSHPTGPSLGAHVAASIGFSNHWGPDNTLALGRRTDGAARPSGASKRSPAEDFNELREARSREDDRIISYIRSLTEADLAGIVRYRTTRSPTNIEQYLAPLLLHFFNHQTHHRGQAHCILTGLTREAPSFDLIVFLRLTGAGIIRGQDGAISQIDRRA
jgi:hypothetical protein